MERHPRLNQQSIATPHCCSLDLHQKDSPKTKTRHDASVKEDFSLKMSPRSCVNDCAYILFARVVSFLHRRLDSLSVPFARLSANGHHQSMENHQILIEDLFWGALGNDIKESSKILSNLIRTENDRCLSPDLGFFLVSVKLKSAS